MYAKLFPRITESSLMEEHIHVRYTFIMLLAIADREGQVIGTDVAIARRLNMAVEEFVSCVSVLMSPDHDSHSRELDGRRITGHTSGRGYKVVNFVAYQEDTGPEDRRAYMREYMRRYRKRQSATGDTSAVTDHANANAPGLAQAGEPQHASPAPAPDDSQPAMRPQSRAAYSVDFERFWRTFPPGRKTDKARAWKAWRSQVSASDVTIVIEAAAEYAASPTGRGQYVKQPATWLNGRCWLDDREAWRRCGDNATDGASRVASRSEEAMTRLQRTIDSLPGMSHDT